MIIEILTPDKKIYEGEIESATFPGTDGSFGVMNNHAPMIASLKEGVIVLVEGTTERSFEIKGGLVEILKNKLTVLAE
ncbi:MAG: ATP synthase F1 subunit epsilon [Flavobacteriales bacterium]|jgi:F-type H+-transporting ATPase subunit epsilon|nr:ATP synthase F1 subunit epsilon [Flavobacteriales bacterium]